MDAPKAPKNGEAEFPSSVLCELTPRRLDLRFSPEVCQRCVSELGRNDRRLLLPLLYVSRATYHMAVELLHERLVVMPDPELLFPPGRQIRLINTPSITVRMKRVPSLMELLSSTEGSRLTKFTKALFFHEVIWSLRIDMRTDIGQIAGVVEALLRHFVNLEQLMLPCPHARTIPQHLQSEIPHFLCLTHLHLTTTSFEEVCEVLRCNPSLRVVVVTGQLLNVVRPGTSLYLPNLRCYTGPYVTWPYIVEASPHLENLGAAWTTSEAPPKPDLYSNIQAIDLTVSENEPGHPLFPYLKGVEYLHVVSMRPVYLSIELTDEVRRIPSLSLKYVSIRFMQTAPINPWTVAKSLFKGLPSLKLVDIITIAKVGPPTLPHNETHRYARDMIPRWVDLPRTDIFGRWWDDAQHEVEAMIRLGPAQDTRDSVMTGC